MYNDNDGPGGEEKPRTRNLGQAIIAAAVGLPIIVGVACAFDWDLNSGFWRGMGYFVLEIVSHLGK